MSSTPLRHIFVLGLAGAMVLPGLAVANTPGTYLSWQNKAAQPAAAPISQPGAQPGTMPEAPPASVTSGGQAYPVPPSPYGQVGDPFARSLSWPSKQGAQKPAAGPAPKAPELASVQPLPPSKPAPISVPVPPRPLEPQHPTASVSAPVPLAAPKPVSVPKQAVATAHSAPQSAPVAQPVTKPAAPVSQPAADAGYQVPSTSKYAAQIAAARAHQAQQQAAEALDIQNQKKAVGIATVPTPTAQLASEETDRVFIPGEQYKNAGDAPRLYSLHRAYGLTPDPIVVDHSATGAILGPVDLHADEAEDDDRPPASSESASKAKP